MIAKSLAAVLIVLALGCRPPHGAQEHSNTATTNSKVADCDFSAEVSTATRCVVEKLESEKQRATDAGDTATADCIGDKLAQVKALAPATGDALEALHDEAQMCGGGSPRPE